jgi:hypothetical protein
VYHTILINIRRCYIILYIVYVEKKLLHCILTISLVCVPYILLLYCKLCKVSIWLKYSLKLYLHVVCRTCQNNLRPLMPIVELSTAIVSSFPQGRKVTEEIHVFFNARTCMNKLSFRMFYFVAKWTVRCVRARCLEHN